MTTFYVKKDGSGTHDNIQAAIMDAQVGDIVEVGPGIWVENVDLYKDITLKGAGRDQTTIQGTAGLTSVVKAGTWALGSTTLNFAGGTAGFEKGRIISGTGIPAGTRIVSVSPNSVQISAATTAARTVATNATMQKVNQSTIRIRQNPKLKDVKVVGFDNGVSATENAAIYCMKAGDGNTAANGFEIDSCEIVADGDYGILTDYINTVGNGIVNNCLISGKTFTGTNPGKGDQYAVANVPRQLVVFQIPNLPITFTNNVITGTTGGLTTSGETSFNTAVSVEGLNSVITNNTFNGFFGTGYALRVRTTATVENNLNRIEGQKLNSGYLIGPSGNQQAGLNVGSNTSFEFFLVAPSQEVAGAPIKATVSKDSLKTLDKVSSDPYFSIDSNWKQVSYIYKKPNSSLRLAVGFRDLSVEKQASLKAGMSSGDKLELIKIIISDPSRSLLVLKRSEIPEAESYDVTLK